jgi:hypothetical protein
LEDQRAVYFFMINYALVGFIINGVSDMRQTFFVYTARRTVKWFSFDTRLLALKSEIELFMQLKSTAIFPLPLKYSEDELYVDSGLFIMCYLYRMCLQNTINYAQLSFAP